MLLHTGSLQGVLTAFSALMFVVVLIVCLKPILRFIQQKQRSAGAGRDVSLSLVTQMSLDRSRRLSLVECGARRVLVLSGGGNDVMMEWSEGSSGFASVLEDMA